MVGGERKMSYKLHRLHSKLCTLLLSCMELVYSYSTDTGMQHTHTPSQPHTLTHALTLSSSFASAISSAISSMSPTLL